jgi:acyl-CoA thioester hydrolase
LRGQISFSMKVRVYYEDTDISGFLYHSKYLNYCERARSELFFKRGETPINGDSHFVVRKLEADFLKPATFGDILEVKTEIVQIKKVSLQLSQKIYREDEKLFEAKITLAHLRGTKPAKIEEKVLEIF